MCSLLFLAAFFAEMTVRVQNLAKAPSDSSLFQESVKASILTPEGLLGKLRWDGQQLILIEGIHYKPEETVAQVQELSALISRPEVVERFAAVTPLDKIEKQNSSKPIPWFSLWDVRLQHVTEFMSYSRPLREGVSGH